MKNYTIKVLIFFIALGIFTSINGALIMVGDKNITVSEEAKNYNGYLPLYLENILIDNGFTYYSSGEYASYGFTTIFILTSFHGITIEYDNIDDGIIYRVTNNKYYFINNKVGYYVGTSYIEHEIETYILIFGLSNYEEEN